MLKNRDVLRGGLAAAKERFGGLLEKLGRRPAAIGAATGHSRRARMIVQASLHDAGSPQP
jgi:hypothetical protein